VKNVLLIGQKYLTAAHRCSHNTSCFFKRAYE